MLHAVILSPSKVLLQTKFDQIIILTHISPLYHLSLKEGQ